LTARAWSLRVRRRGSFRATQLESALTAAQVLTHRAGTLHVTTATPARPVVMPPSRLGRSAAPVAKAMGVASAVPRTSAVVPRPMKLALRTHVPPCTTFRRWCSCHSPRCITPCATALTTAAGGGDIVATQQTHGTWSRAQAQLAILAKPHVHVLVRGIAADVSRVRYVHVCVAERGSSTDRSAARPASPSS